MYKYRVIGGTHTDEKGVSYKKGDTFTSKTALHKIFRNKFEILDEFTEGSVSQQVVIGKPNIFIPSDKIENEEEAAQTSSSFSPNEEKDEVGVGVEEGGEDDDLKRYGEDVTDQFPNAERIEVRVFVKKNWYNVIDDEDGSVLNEKKLRKKDVLPFLAQYLEDEE